MYLCLLQRVCVWPCSRCPVTVHLVCLSSSVWKSVRSNQYMTGTHLGNGAYHATTYTRSWLWAAGPRKGLGAGIAARPAPRSSPGGDLAAGRAPGAASALCAFSLLSPPPPRPRGGGAARCQGAGAAGANPRPPLLLCAPLLCPAAARPAARPRGGWRPVWTERRAAQVCTERRGSAAGGLRGRGRASGAGGRRAGGGSARARSGCGTAREKLTPRGFVREPAEGFGRKGSPSVPRQQCYAARSARGAFGAVKPGGWCRACRRVADCGCRFLAGGTEPPLPGAPRPGWVPALLCPATEVMSFFLSSSRRKLAVFSFLLETMHESIIGPLPLLGCLGANEADADVSALGATTNVYFQLAA